METKEITLLTWDSKENFDQNITQDQLGFTNGTQSLYKNVYRVDTENFNEIIELLDIDDKFVFICHVSSAKELETYFTFQNSNIKIQYPKLKVNYVSKSNSIDVVTKISELNDTTEKVISYARLKDQIKLNDILYQTKNEVLGSISTSHTTEKNLINNTGIVKPIDFAIITALYEEFVDVEKLFNWSEPHLTLNKEYKIGTLIGKENIRVVAAITPTTGMIDSAIIATQMLELFSPKYLIMSGVCGGKKDAKLGDIVLASSVFTFQKGKLSDLKDEDGKLIEIFDENMKKIDLNTIKDKDGKHIEINIELFEKEGEEEPIHTLTKDFIEPKLNQISELLNVHNKIESKKITIHFEPMACSTMVINKKDFFDKRIKSIERKTAAVEMESYGIARACKIANNGYTKFVIFKSVMDNTVEKIDDFKKQAAYNSSQFLKHLLEMEILK